MLSVDGGIVLINFVLSNLSIFMLSFFEVPREVLKKLDYFKSIFFLQSAVNQRGNFQMIRTRRNSQSRVLSSTPSPTGGTRAISPLM